MASVLVTGGTGLELPVVPAPRAWQSQPTDVEEVALPGACSAALRAGADLVPGDRTGGGTWRDLLDGRSPSQPPED